MHSHRIARHLTVAKITEETEPTIKTSSRTLRRGHYGQLSIRDSMVAVLQHASRQTT